MRLDHLLWLTALADACLLSREREAELEARRRGGSSSRAESVFRRQEVNIGQFAIPIGTGDRFEGGAVAPRGLGVDDRDLESILNVDEVHSGLQGLAGAFDDVELFTAPYETFENRSLNGATIGSNPRVFIQSGIHARERGGPDHVLYFVADLLHAREAGSGISYGGQNYSNADVTRALSAGIAIVPLVNPDGVAYDQATNACWRKNRNPESSDPENYRSVGIDLNRNFDFLWDYKEMFSPDADLWAVASEDPASEVFHGTGPLSEPETQNVAWVMDRFASLSWFLDLHSFGGDILYAWGDDDAQSQHADQSFGNTSYNGVRGLLGDDPANSTYGEYITQPDLDAQRSASSRMAQRMSAAGEVPYVAMQSVTLYPTSGGSTDFAMKRFYDRNTEDSCGENRVHGLTIEFGIDSGSLMCPFYPDSHQYHNSARQAAAGLMELLLNAAGEAGEPVVREC